MPKTAAFSSENLPLLSDARRIWATGAYDRALHLFEAAAQQYPDSVWAQLDAARAFAQRHEFNKAESLLDSAQSIASGSASANLLIAQTYQVISRSEKAIDAYRNVWTAGLERSAEVLIQLAKLYERTARIEEAYDLLAAAAEQKTSEPETLLMLARLERRLGRPSESWRLLRTLENSTALPPVRRAELHNEIARMHDQEGDYDAAWSALERSKHILRSQPEAERLSRLSMANCEVLRRLYVNVDASLLRSWREQPPPLDPRARGIGHLLGFPRSGTTLLEQVLDAHPELVEFSGTCCI